MGDGKYNTMAVAYKKQLLRLYGGAAGRITALSAFIREFAHAPFHVGSICPSSVALTSRMINYLSREKEGLIIDLGAGSGIVSRQLLRAGIVSSRILAVENSPGFEKMFTRACPDVVLVMEDARNLENILARHAPGVPINAIISSLPLRAMPPPLRHEVMLALKQALIKQGGGSLIQYTYAWWLEYPLARYGFIPVARQVVWKNLPPARVEAYVV